MAGLTIDSSGNLYGTTNSGGSGQFGFGGTVFELSPPSQPGGTWSETILYSFGASREDASGPQASVIFDAQGNPYGTTIAVGELGPGAVFQLMPPSEPGGAWTENILHAFGSVPRDGATPQSALTLAPSGVLLGTTEEGGVNYGVVFALAPPSGPGGSWQYGLPYTFTGRLDGGNPQSRLTLLPGKNPIIYGTTRRGGAFDEGTVYQLVPPLPGGSWTEAPVYSFSGGNDGGHPESGVVVYSYALFGTTTEGGSHGFGTAFRLSR